MTDETISVTRAIAAPADEVFAVLADPAKHAAIDGTGWVGRAVDAGRLTAPGQVFRMAMFHEHHPDRDYEMANQVDVLEPPRAIAWRPGRPDATGTLRFGGWSWRYDLADRGPDGTEVTLTYDWSAVPPPVRENIDFPPFAPGHLENSLAHLEELVTSARPAS